MATKLTLYHGSEAGLEGSIRPVSHSACDFGAGFYMGTEPMQPKTLICEDAHPVFYTLSLDLARLKVVTLAPDETWALFVAFNRGKLSAYREMPFFRRFEEMRATADVICGRIADDRMFTVMNLFFQGLVGVTALVESMKALNVGEQYCAITPRACAQIEILSEQRFSPVELETLRARCLRQRQRGGALAEDICRRLRREGESFDEILARLSAEKGEMP